MTTRISVVLAALLVSMLVPFSAGGQTVNGGTAPNVDLRARLKEVESNPRQFETIIKAGSKIAALCANCHGAGGNSANTDVPNLAGQNTTYLLAQLHEFSDGARRNVFKEKIMKFVSPDEKVGLVAFYSLQAVAPKPSGDTALIRLGKERYKTYCADCHEDNGHGTDKLPRVAGQQVGYLTASLKRYRSGSKIRINRPMANGMQEMTEADITSVVAYVSSMK
jgi:cytochrome c553